MNDENKCCGDGCNCCGTTGDIDSLPSDRLSGLQGDTGPLGKAEPATIEKSDFYLEVGTEITYGFKIYSITPRDVIVRRENKISLPYPAEFSVGNQIFRARKVTKKNIYYRPDKTSLNARSFLKIGPDDEQKRAHKK